MKQSIGSSFKHAFEGILTVFKKERNFKIHCSFIIAVCICGFFFRITKQEWITCLLLFGLVLSLEILNTAIESVVDLASPIYHEKAKIAKDCAAGAVLAAAFFAAIIGLMIFIPYGLKFLGISFSSCICLLNSL